MIISNLSQTPYSTIHSTFIKAFSDYKIPIDTTLEELLFENKQRGIDLNLSYGSFTTNGELVGFIFCGKQIKDNKVDYYNGATGVIPSFRCRNIGKELLISAINNARENNANSFTLEVLYENTIAQKLYKSNGFSTTRDLFCYQKSIDSIEDIDTSLYSTYTPNLTNYTSIISKLPLPFEPSWQSSFFSVSNIYNFLVTKILIRDGKEIGFFILNPETGQILQISAKDNCVNIMKILISLASSLTKTKKLMFINIDSNSIFTSYLENDNWNLFAKQYEMKLCYK